MHNSFDISEHKEIHPFRAIMQLHFPNHIMVQELTTAHLIDEFAVFNQIFAFTHEGMSRCINDCLDTYEFTRDCNWEYRAQIKDLGWEERYIDIFNDYTKQMCDAIWADEDALHHDEEFQTFIKVIDETLPNGIPARYNKLHSIKDVAFFMASVIHVVTVRHEIYGTTVVNYQLDHRYGGITQVIDDGSTCAKEDYLSLILIAVATSRKIFIKFQHYPEFEKLMAVVADKKLRDQLIAHFKVMQGKLNDLDDEWKKDLDWAQRNAVVLPSDLEIAAGY
jgi:hypothetical protein